MRTISRLNWSMLNYYFQCQKCWVFIIKALVLSNNSKSNRFRYVLDTIFTHFTNVFAVEKVKKLCKALYTLAMRDALRIFEFLTRIYQRSRHHDNLTSRCVYLSLKKNHPEIHSLHPSITENVIFRSQINLLKK